MKRKPLLICLALACILTLTTAGAADKWLHVKVEEDHGDNIDINIPLSLVETMLPLITFDELQKGKLRLDIDEFEGLDLRELAAALHDSPDTDFVTVNSKDESIRVAKEGDFIVVRVEEKKRRGAETVRIRIPLAVVDALIGGSPNELDLLAALRVLSEFDGETLVDVQSDGSSVRIWIDSDETGHRGMVR